MHCNRVASSELVVCPGCGRELREAPPKLLTFGAPVVLTVLLVALLVTQWERINPIAWARSNLVRGVVLVENMSARIEPEMVIMMTPIVEEPAVDSSDAQVVAIAAEGGVAQGKESLITPVPDPNVSQSRESGLLAAVNEEPPAASAEPSLGIGGPRDEQADSAVAVMQEAAAGETSASIEATVDSAEGPPAGVAAALAAEEPTATPPAVDEAQAASGAEEASLPTPLPTATATPTPVMTPTPAPTPTPVVYQVERGDTLVLIASEYGVDVEDLMAANDIGERDVFAIQPGQMLIIPVPAEAPAEVEVAAAGDTAALRLDAPQLLVPPDGATIGCETGGALIWERVQFVKDSDRYVLHLGFVSGQESDGQEGRGGEKITWVLAQNVPVTQTEWQLDTNLCDLAPEEYDGQWRWWVEVIEKVDGNDISVSPPSEIRGFIWK